MKRLFATLFVISMLIPNVPFLGFNAVSAIEPSALDGSLRWLGEKSTLDDIAWKPDGSYGLVLGWGGEVLKYDGNEFKMLTSTLGYDPYDAEWAPDGTYALLVGTRGNISKYDESSFTKIYSPVTVDLSKVSWKSDGSYALITGDCGILMMYDGTNLTLLDSYTKSDLFSINWDKSFSSAIIVGDNGTALKYDAATNSTRWLGEKYSLDDIAWKPNGSYGLVVGWGSIVLKYDGTDFYVLNTSLGFNPYDVDWTPDGSYALIIGTGGKVVMFNGDNFTKVASITMNNLNKVAWKPDGTFALIVGVNGTILTYNGTALETVMSKVNNDLTSIAWDRVGENALIVGEEGTAMMYNTTTKAVEWLGEGNTIDEIAWKPDGSIGILVGYGGMVLKYDGIKFEKLITGLSSNLNDVDWRPDGNYSLMIGERGQCVKYNGTSFTSLTSGTNNELLKLAWKQDGSIALLVGVSGTILKFDGTNFSTIPKLKGLTADLYSICWNISGDYAVIVGNNGAILKYIVSTDEVTWLGQDIKLDEIAWKPDGSYGLIVGDGGFVMKYDGQNFYVLSTGLATYLNDVNWSPDGSYAMMVGAGGMVVKYNGTGFTSLTSGTINDLFKVAFKPDGSFAVIVGAAGVMLKFNGTNFTAVNSGISNDLYGIAWNDTTAIIVGDKGNVTTYDGTNVVQLESNTTAMLYDVDWKPDGSYALIIADGGKILKYDGLGFENYTTGLNSWQNDFYYNNNLKSLCTVDWNPDGSCALIVGYDGSGSNYCVWTYNETAFTEDELRNLPRGLSWHPLLDRVLIVGDNGEVIEYNGTEYVNRSGCTGQMLYDLDWRPDGSYALIISNGGEILKYNGTAFTIQNTGLPSWQNDFYYQAGLKSSCTVKWKPDGTFALIVGYDPSSSENYATWFYDGENFSQASLRNLPRGLCWHPSGTYAVITGDEGQVIQFNESGFIKKSSCTGQMLYDLDFKPNGSYALIVSNGGEILKYDGLAFTIQNTGLPSWQNDFYYQAGLKSICTVKWKPDGSYAMIVGYDPSASQNYNAWIYNDNNFTESPVRNLPRGFCWCPNESAFLIVGDNGQVIRYDGTQMIYKSSSTHQMLYDADWKPDGSYLLVVSNGGEILKYDGSSFIIQNTELPSWQNDFYYHSLEKSICTLEWKSDGAFAVIVGYDASGSTPYNIWKYDGATFLQNDIRYLARGLGWRPGTNYTIIVGDKGQVMKYDGTNLLLKSSCTDRFLHSVAWKPDGSYALVVSDNGEVLKYDGSTFSIQNTMLGSWQNDFYYHPQSRSVASIDWKFDGTFCVIVGYDASSSPPYQMWHYDGATFIEHSLSSQPRGVSFKPDGSKALIVGDGGAAWTYDGVNINPVDTGVVANLNAVAWKPDGSYALIVGASGTVLSYDGLVFTNLTNSSVTANLRAMDWKSDGSYCLIAGAKGFVSKYDGSTFRILNTGLAADLNRVSINSTAALFVGDSGTMLVYDGTAFIPVEVDTKTNFYGVDWSLDGSYAVAVGNNGTIFRMSGIPSAPIRDILSPGPIVDLTASSPTNNSMTLSWTAPGDDGDTGVASGYQVKYSTASAITTSNWNTATSFSQSWRPHTAGSAEQHVITGLRANTTYYYAVKTFDEVPNYSDLSNSPTARTLPITVGPPPPPPPPPPPVDTPVYNATTSWNVNRDVYPFRNTGTAWTNGNSYGMSATELLYYRHVQGVSGNPYLPLESNARYTSELDQPSNTLTELNNVNLGVMMHQTYDPLNKNIDWNQFYLLNEYLKLNNSLSAGQPAAIGLGPNNPHAVVVTELHVYRNKTVEMTISDPSSPSPLTQTRAYYNESAGTFTYRNNPDWMKFIVLDPKVMESSWFYFWDWSSAWYKQWVDCAVPNYYIVASDASIRVNTSDGRTDRFVEVGNSQTFQSGISGTSGISEGKIVVYALPIGAKYTLTKDTPGSAFLYIGYVKDQQGARKGYSYFFNITGAGQGNYKLDISNETSLKLTPGNSSVSTRTIISYMDQNGNRYTFNAGGFPTNSGQAAEFRVTDWTLLSSTSKSSVTLNYYKKGESAPTQTYKLRNGQNGLVSKPPPPVTNRLNPLLIAIVVLVIVGVSIGTALVVVKARKQQAREQQANQRLMQERKTSEKMAKTEGPDAKQKVVARASVGSGKDEDEPVSVVEVVADTEATETVKAPTQKKLKSEPKKEEEEDIPEMQAVEEEAFVKIDEARENAINERNQDLLKEINQAETQGVNVQGALQFVRLASTALDEQKYDLCEENLTKAEDTLMTAVDEHVQKKAVLQKIKCPGCKKVFNFEKKETPTKITCPHCGKVGKV